ncbi:MAG: hypothetical protein K2X39_05390 [Silvanigrellaceae bacterium]|nr:hypothetical protein [Silvanigrellaceae bacterium]
MSAPNINTVLNFTLPSIAIFGGISLVGKIAHVHLMPIAITAAIVPLAVNVLHSVITSCQWKKAKAEACQILGGSLIMAIQILALRKCGFLDKRTTIAFISAFSITGVVQSVARLLNE